MQSGIGTDDRVEDPCLDDDAAAAFVDHALPARRRQRIEAHLERCAACRRHVTALAQVLSGTIDVDDAVGELAAPELLRAGERVGRYELERPLGAGGMGVVWLARDPELQRSVALKLPRRVLLETDRAGETMRREARALARLHDRRIVEIFDIGCDGDRSYIAMRYIDGLTLDRWAAARRPAGWPQILAVCIDAGRGLAAAHRAGLLHRDVKPSNILVDDAGLACITDFGLALAFEQDARVRLDGGQTLHSRDASQGTSVTGSTSPTAIGTLMGTLPYMAPEQQRGEPVGEASDQYAFCVTMFESLYGARPFRGDDHDELLQAKMRATPAVPQERGGVPTWLQAALVRGLAARPDRRWPSIDALLAALDRGHGRARRRRAAMGIGALGLAVAGLLVGVPERASVTAERVEASQWPRTVVAARERAAVLQLENGDYADAEHTATLAYYEAVELGDWDVAAAAATLLCGLVVDGGAREAEGLTWARHAETALTHTEDPVSLLEARRLHALGKVRAAAGEHEAARTIHARAVALTEAALGPDDPALALGLVHLGHAQLDLGAPAEARALYERAIGISTVALGSDHRDVARGLHSLASVHFATGELSHARALQERALVLLEHALAPDHPEIAVVLSSLAITHASAGDYERARPLFERAVAIATTRFDADSPRVAAHLENLASLYYVMSEYEQARPLYERALAIREKAFGSRHPELAASLENLGHLHRQAGHVEQAAALYERALAIKEATYGPDHIEVALGLQNVAMTVSIAGEHARARALLERALVIRERTQGRDHRDVADAAFNLALEREQAGEHQSARALHERALAIRERALGPDHPQVAASLDQIARAHYADGEYREGRRLHVRALSILERTLGPEHIRLAKHLTQYGLALLDAGEGARARSVLERAAAIYERHDPSAHGEFWTRFDLAKALLDAGGDRARAVALAEQSRDGWRKGGDATAGKLDEVESWLRSGPRRSRR